VKFAAGKTGTVAGVPVDMASASAAADTASAAADMASASAAAVPANTASAAAADTASAVATSALAVMAAADTVSKFAVKHIDPKDVLASMRVAIVRLLQVRGLPTPSEVVDTYVKFVRIGVCTPRYFP